VRFENLAAGVWSMQGMGEPSREVSWPCPEVVESGETHDACTLAQMGKTVE